MWWGLWQFLLLRSVRTCCRFTIEVTLFILGEASAPWSALLTTSPLPIEAGWDGVGLGGGPYLSFRSTSPFHAIGRDWQEEQINVIKLDWLEFGNTRDRDDDEDEDDAKTTEKGILFLHCLIWAGKRERVIEITRKICTLWSYAITASLRISFWPTILL